MRFPSRFDEPSAADPEIVVITPDLSRNAVGRALVLVDLVRRDRTVTLAGRAKHTRWPPLNGRTDVRILELPSDLRAARRAIARGFPNATILASKPLLPSFGLALAVSQGPVILDIDDPEMELATADLRTVLSVIRGLENPVLTRALIGLRHRAAGITVANELLRGRYGGAVIPHARDETWFDEGVRSRAYARRQLGLDETMRLVTFVGTTRRHKGISVLLEAHRLLHHSTLAIVGSADVPQEDRVIAVPPVNYPTAMRWLAAADVVVVPQRDTRIGRLQSPAKLVDALAMGRAIVATDLPPIVETVGEAAELVPPDSAQSLAGAMSRLLEDGERRAVLEAKARLRFLGALSQGAVRPRMMDVVREAERAHKAGSHGMR